MRYTKMNPNDFKHMTFGAGIIVDEFAPDTGEVQSSAIRWATTGDNSFTATRDMLDMGADINNCPENIQYQCLKLVDVLQRAIIRANMLFVVS